MRVDVIVLNGGSSSGTSSIARSLQNLLKGPWIALGIDHLLHALSPSLVGDAPPREGERPLLRYGESGEVSVELGWHDLESAWYAGLASMARTGARLILDEVILGGGSDQRRLAATFQGLSLLWVGVRCDPAVAAAREARRPDRVIGMAVSQALKVHEGVRYDIVVDTTTASTEQCAHAILKRMQ